MNIKIVQMSKKRVVQMSKKNSSNSQDNIWAKRFRQDRLGGLVLRPGLALNFNNFQQLISIYLGLGLVMTLSVPSTAARRLSAVARTGQGAKRRSYDRLGSCALRLGQARGPSATTRTGQGLTCSFELFFTNLNYFLAHLNYFF